MKKYLLYILVCLSSLITAQTSVAQTFEASATIDTTEIIIGDQVNFRWQIAAPKGYTVAVPQFADTLVDKVEIVKKGKVDSVISEKEIILKQTLVITSFDSGYYRVPPIEFDVISQDSDTLNVTTNELYLLVNTLEVDTTLAIKDIKQPISEPVTFKEVLPYILGGLALVAVIFAAIYIIRRLKKKKPVISKPKPKIPPHITAKENLDKLKNKKLWHQGLIKQYHSELTEIVRAYIEDCMEVNSLEMTTDETLEALKAKALGTEAIDKLRQLLWLADLVKFAKQTPLPTEHDLSMTNAYGFIEITKHYYKAPEENNNEENTNQEVKTER